MNRAAPWPETVLKVLHDAKTPQSAYDVLGKLRAQHPHIAPTTVYRALSTLTKREQIHRLESMNAYVVCQHNHSAHKPILAICDHCGRVEESVAPKVMTALDDLAEKSGFAASRQVIELHGQCVTCSESTV